MFSSRFDKINDNNDEYYIPDSISFFNLLIEQQINYYKKIIDSLKKSKMNSKVGNEQKHEKTNQFISNCGDSIVENDKNSNDLLIQSYIKDQKLRNQKLIT